MISNLNLDIEILHIEIDLNMLFLIFIEYEIDFRGFSSTTLQIDKLNIKSEQ